MPQLRGQTLVGRLHGSKVKTLGRLGLLMPLLWGLANPCAAIEPNNRLRAVEDYLNRQLKSRLLIPRKPIPALPRLEYDEEGQFVTDFASRVGGEPFGLLFLKIAVGPETIELATERVKLSHLRAGPGGRKLRLDKRGQKTFPLVRIFFRVGSKFLFTDDLKMAAQRLLLRVFLSQEEWRTRNAAGLPGSLPGVGGHNPGGEAFAPLSGP